MQLFGESWNFLIYLQLALVWLPRVTSFFQRILILQSFYLFYCLEFHFRGLLDGSVPMFQDLLLDSHLSVGMALNKECEIGKLTPIRDSGWSWPTVADGASLNLHPVESTFWAGFDEIENTGLFVLTWMDFVVDGSTACLCESFIAVHKHLLQSKICSVIVVFGHHFICQLIKLFYLPF